MTTYEIQQTPLKIPNSDLKVSDGARQQKLPKKEFGAALNFDAYITDVPATHSISNEIAPEVLRNKPKKGQKEEYLFKSKLVSDLSFSGYVVDVPISRKTSDEIASEVLKDKEKTRSKLALWLLSLLGFTLASSFLVTGVMIFHPKANKESIKDLIGMVLTPQVSLLSCALCYYFGGNSKE